MSDSDRHSLLNDPEHWQKQALEMRRMAESSRADVRERLLSLAEEYDGLARKAEKRRASAWSARKP
jgi:hypothetical protein